MTEKTNENQNDQKELWTPEEIATLLGLTPHAIRKHIRTESLKAEKQGRKWVIQPEDALDFMHRYQAGDIPKRGFGSPDHPLYGVGRQPDPEATERRERIREALSTDEQLDILERFAELKRLDQEKFEQEFEKIKG